ncbi:MAG: 2-hydroxychromene-2-carboxylate isomerase [Pseudomonadota bacterium]
MAKTIDFYFDFGSPNAYLVEAVLPGIAARHGAEIRRVPVLLGGLFKSTGNASPMFRFADVAGKVAYLRTEMNRFVAKHNVPFLWNPHFPILTTPLMRGALVARGQAWEDAYRQVCYRHCWVEGSNMTDIAVIGEVLAREGLPAAEILEGIQTPEVKAALFASTEEAANRGAFGVPTMFVGDEMFFGKDALGDLEDALADTGA